MFEEKLRRDKERADRRRSEFGHVKEVIQLQRGEDRWVAVGNEILRIPSRSTFFDFLIVYSIHILGRDWMEEELDKNQGNIHPIMEWYKQVMDRTRERKPDEFGVIEVTRDGIILSYFLLAYDLYILRHHAALQDMVIRRLKNIRQFQGARYELLVAATMIRAGFNIEYEDETSGLSKPPEFRATHKASGLRLAVEAKSRHRPGILGNDGDPEPLKNTRLGIRRLVASAQGKDVQDPYLLFLDVNMPPEYTESSSPSWAEEAEIVMAGFEQRLGPEFKISAAIITNIPHHYGVAKQPAPQSALKVINFYNCKRPISSTEVLHIVARSIIQYGNVPIDFPDDIN